MRSLAFGKRFVFFQLCTHLNLVVFRLYYAVAGVVYLGRWLST